MCFRIVAYAVSIMLLEQISTIAKKYGIYYKAPKYIRAWMWFLYNYLIRFGFLDGKEGFLFCYFECYWYRMLVDAKIYEYEKFGGKFETLKALD